VVDVPAVELSVVLLENDFDFTLQFFFIATSCLGWWNWLRGGAEKDELPITRTNPFRLALDLFVALVVLGIGVVSHRLSFR